jgi:NAD+ diphosphatase
MSRAEFEPAFVEPADTAEAILFAMPRGRRELLVPEEGPLGDGLLQAVRVLEAQAVMRRVFLGMLGGRPCYAVEVPEDFQAPGGWSFHSLRALVGAVDEVLYAAAGSAVQLLHWDRTHAFCGCCGTATVAKGDERAKLCPACGHVAYPRINPAIIVAVTRGDELLLARSRRSRTGVFSVLAGYVEVGESLEAAVRREVMEEVAVELRDVRYFGSQCWPFPSTLMVGFTASHARGDICVDGHEVVEADWYRADALPPIPSHGSISRRLIEAFVKQHGG